MADASPKRPQPDDRQLPTAAFSLPKRPHPDSNHNKQSESSATPRDTTTAALNVIDSDDDEDDEDFTSSSGSDSSDDESEDDDQDDVKSGNGSPDSMPRITAQGKPRIQRVNGDPELMSRLSAFLPQMKIANEELQREIEAGRGADIRLDNVDEQNEGRYIEMNLGLGVLEEQRADDDIGLNEEDHAHADGNSKESNSEKDSNIMDTLMGNKDSPKSKPTIEEVKE